MAWAVSEAAFLASDFSGARNFDGHSAQTAYADCGKQQQFLLFFAPEASRSNQQALGVEHNCHNCWATKGVVHACLFARRGGDGSRFNRGERGLGFISAGLALNMLDDALACSPPGVAASSPIMQDFAILPVSDNAPAASEAAASGGSAIKSPAAVATTAARAWTAARRSGYGSAGAVFLRRSQPTAGTIIGAQPSGSPAFSRGSDFDFGWDAGPDITIGRRIGCEDSLEARYFNSYAGAGIQFVTPSSFIGAGFTGPGGITISGLTSPD